MHSVEFVAAGEFCAFHHAELSFIEGLHASGLIEMTIRDGAMLLPAEDLPSLEKFIRWHYELAINFEGIEALAHLLDRVDGLQEENRMLRNKVRFFEGPSGNRMEAAEEI